MPPDTLGHHRSAGAVHQLHLKRSPEVSHTQGLAEISIEIMRRQGVTVDVVRAVDHHIATGVWPDMTEHGWERDEWPTTAASAAAW